MTAARLGTASGRDYLNLVASLGCIVRDEHCRGRVEIHHVRHGTSRRDNARVIPLCARHHREGPRGVAIHAGKKPWAAAYGSPDELLLKVEELLSAGA